MRVTYMDKSGLSKREPILIEAAIIVHGDDQVIPVEEYLESLVEKGDVSLDTTNTWGSVL